MLFDFLKLGLLFATSSLCASVAAADSQKTLQQPHQKFSDIKEALKKAAIISDVVDEFEPKCVVVPHYGKKHRAVDLGNKFKQKQTEDRPSVHIHCPDMNATPGLTLALTDPDAPSRDNPKWSEMCHWIGIATARSDPSLESEMDDNTEFELIKYKPPGPPAGTGYHRYVFLVLEGPNLNLTLPEDRQHWGMGKAGNGVREWAKKEGLKVIGANFFLEKNKKQKANEELCL